MPMVTTPILRDADSGQLAADMGERLAEPRAVDRVVEPAARSRRVGQRYRDRVVEHEALADRLAEAPDAEQLRRRRQPDRDDERGLQQAQLRLPPRGAERLLRGRRPPVAATARARAGKAAGDRGAVEQVEKRLLVEAKPAAQRPAGPALPRSSRLGLDAAGREAEKVRALPRPALEHRSRDDRKARLEAAAAARVSALEPRERVRRHLGARSKAANPPRPGSQSSYSGARRPW